MKIFVLSPNVKVLFGDVHRKALQGAGEVTYISTIKPLKEITELCEGSEPRILAIDPDFTEWKLPNDVIDSIPNLKAICLQTTSFSWVDTEHAKAKGIPVTNLRGFSTIAVVEWATMVVLALVRKLPIVIKDNWKADYNQHRGIELRGKTVGVIGLGKMGTAFVQNMSGLGMDVQYWSKNTRNKDFNFVELEDLMKTSDVIFFSVANNDETKKLLSDDLLRSMKSSAIFMNIVDPIYNHKLMLDMVKTGKLFGYGFEQDGLALGSHEGNVWDGPALGWCTNESFQKNAQQWVDSIVAAAKQDYPTQVN